MLRILGVLLLLAAVSVGSADARSAPVARRASADSLGSVTGVVYDSLLGQPAADVVVFILDTDRFVRTDARGRFRLDSVPVGLRVLKADLPAADTLGIRPLLERVIEVRADAVERVDFAVPRFDEFARLLCPTAPGARAGIVFGTVRDARTDALLVGAEVYAEWTQLIRSRAKAVSFPRQVARTDSTGRYALCGVSAEWLLSISAAAGDAGTGRIESRLGERRVMRRDFWVDLDAAATEAATAVRRDSAVADSAGAAVPRRVAGVTLRGDVRDGRTGEPVPGVRASLDGLDLESVGDSAGTFYLSGVPRGTQVLLLRRLGYAPQRVPVDLRGPGPHSVALSFGSVADLPPVRIFSPLGGRTSARLLERREFEERKRMGLARILDGKVLERRGSEPMLLTLQGIPNVQLRYNAQGQPELQVRRGVGTCAPRLFLDGFPTDVGVLAVLPASDMAAIEIYPRNTGVPIRFARYDDCGTLLFWTKEKFAIAR